MTGRASIADILRNGFEATKKNASTVLALFVGLHAVVFILAYVLNASFLNILMVPVVLFMQIALLKTYKTPITKFDINDILDLKDTHLKSKLWKLFLTYVIYAVLIILLLLLLVVPGIIFMVYWYVFPYVVLDQHLSGMAALKKSREMIKGNWWRTFALFVIALLIGAISSSVVTGISGTNAFMAGLLMSVVSGLISVYFGYVGVAYYLSLKR